MRSEEHHCFEMEIKQHYFYIMESKQRYFFKITEDNIVALK